MAIFVCLSALSRLSFTLRVRRHACRVCVCSTFCGKHTDDITQKKIENIPYRRKTNRTAKKHNSHKNITDHKQPKTYQSSNTKNEDTPRQTENIPQKTTTSQSVQVCNVLDACVFTSCKSQAVMFSHSHHHTPRCHDTLCGADAYAMTTCTSEKLVFMLCVVQTHFPLGRVRGV